MTLDDNRQHDRSSSSSSSSSSSASSSAPAAATESLLATHRLRRSPSNHLRVTLSDILLLQRQNQDADGPRRHASARSRWNVHASVLRRGLRTRPSSAPAGVVV